MMARVIVIVSAVIAYFPVFLLSFSPLRASGGVSIFLLPVLGFCPLPSSSGQEGYSVASAEIWGLCTLGVFILLGIVAIVRKSVPLAWVFAGLIGISVLLVIVRAVAGLESLRGIG
jgi:hypothetical protein